MKHTNRSVTELREMLIVYVADNVRSMSNSDKGARAKAKAQTAEVVEELALRGYEVVL